MRTGTKLATYGVGLLVVFAGSYGSGRSWDPTSNAQDDPAPATTEVPGSDGHGQEGSP